MNYVEALQPILRRPRMMMQPTADPSLSPPLRSGSENGLYDDLPSPKDTALSGALGHEPSDPSSQTRARRVTPELSDPNAKRVRFTNPVRYSDTGRPELQPHNYGADPIDSLSKEYSALQTWHPEHKENKFLAALKSAGMAVALNSRPGQSLGETIGQAAGGAGVGMATGNSDQYRREMDMRSTGRDLQGALGLEKEKQQVANMGMVPVQLNDGRIVMAQRAKAADLESRQQSVAQGNARLDETKAQNKAHRDRWEAMGAKERRAQIVNEYKAGMLNDPDSLEYAAKELDIPGDLKPAFIAGKMRDAIDASGNLIQVNRQTGESTPVVNDGKPVGSFEGTKEKGRNSRQVRAEAAALERTELGIEGRLKVARLGIKAQADRMGDPDEMTNWANQYRQDAKDKRAAAAKINPQTQSELDQQRQLNKEAADLEKAARDLGAQSNRARGGQNGVSPSVTLDGAIKAFKVRAHRDPTPDEIENIRKHYGLPAVKQSVQVGGSAQ